MAKRAWSSQQRKKFMATLQRKKQERNKIVSIPLDVVPDQVLPSRHARTRSVPSVSPEIQLAYEIVQLLRELLRK